MKMSLKSLAVLVLVGLGGGQALACATCFGQSDSEMAKGMNAGIFVLLGFVALFWAAFGSFFVFIVRRSQNTGDVLPGDQNDPQHN
jgi:hypothetical protein